MGFFPHKETVLRNSTEQQTEYIQKNTNFDNNLLALKVARPLVSTKELLRDRTFQRQVLLVDEISLPYLQALQGLQG